MSSSESDFDINDKFPEAEFYIEIKHNKDEIISTEENIYLRINRDCYCYSDLTKIEKYPLYIKVEKINVNGISYGDCINTLIKNKEFNEKLCNHRFLENFDKISNVIYETYFGS
jgi:hypothetical protein